MNTSLADIKSQLRKRFLEARKSVSTGQREALNAGICDHVLKRFQSCSGLKIAAYAAFRGEPDIVEALHQLAKSRHRIFLPVVIGHRINFRRWIPAGRMRKNVFGINEPAHGEMIDPSQLDHVLMPLVSVDHNGRRLGMGGGFYDRCFAFKAENYDRSPSLIGVAYAIQKYSTDGPEDLPTEPWDIRLNELITEQGRFSFS